MGEEKTANENATQATELAKRLEERKKKIEAAKVAINSAAQDENVRIVLSFLREQAGHEVSPAVIGNDFEVKVSSTIHNVGRLSLYHDMRKLMSAETKNIVERSE